jgi:hypothetical protein
VSEIAKRRRKEKRDVEWYLAAALLLVAILVIDKRVQLRCQSDRR